VTGATNRANLTVSISPAVSFCLSVAIGIPQSHYEIFNHILGQGMLSHAEQCKQMCKTSAIRCARCRDSGKQGYRDTGILGYMDTDAKIHG